jgi:polyhydroxyalkanoate synthesis regulator phasin
MIETTDLRRGAASAEEPSDRARRRLKVSTTMTRVMHWKVLSGGLALAILALTLLTATGASAAEFRRGHVAGRDALRADCLRVLAHGSQLSQSLDELVTNGTLTSDQAAAVREKVVSNSSKVDRACAGLALFHSAGVGDAVRGLLKVDGPALRSELRGGKSLAEIAQEKNVSRDQLISTITGAVTSKLDTWVASGKLTAEREQELLTDLAPRIQALVDWHIGDRRNQANSTATPVAGQ